MSHLFVWIGSDAQSKLAVADRHFRQWKGREADVSWSTALAALWVAGSGRIAAGAQAPTDATGEPLLGWCGHAWARQGLSLSETRLAQGRPLFEQLAETRDRFDGVFGLALVEPAGGRAAIASDALGSMHLYWRRFDEGVAVSTSSLLLARLAPADLDPVGVQELLEMAVPNEDRSLWIGVRKLRGGEILCLERGRAPVLRAHRPLIASLREPTVPLDESVRRLHAAIGGVLARVCADGRPIVDVTGGNDSRALAAALCAHDRPFVSTVTGEDDLDDVRISARLARAGGWEHDPRKPAPPPDAQTVLAALRLTDGEFDAFEFSGVRAVHLAHEGRPYALSMNGSYGETGRGYPWRLGPRALFLPDAMARRLLVTDPVDSGRQGAERFGRASTLVIRPDLRLDWAIHGARMIGRLQERYPGLPQCAQLDLVHIDLRMERWQGRIASSTNQIWPAISPWGFQETLETLLTTHPCARRNSLLTRAYTLFAAPQIANELLFTGNPARPFSWRHAHRFVPAVAYYGSRVRARLRSWRNVPAGPPRSVAQRYADALASPWIQECLRAPALAQTGLFEEAELMRALDREAPRTDAETIRWQRLLTLEMILRASRQSDLGGIGAL